MGRGAEAYPGQCDDSNGLQPLSIQLRKNLAHLAAADPLVEDDDDDRAASARR
jgi:hypothetical protein